MHGSETIHFRCYGRVGMTWLAFVGLLLATIIVVGAAGVAAYDRLVVWFDRRRDGVEQRTQGVAVDGRNGGSTAGREVPSSRRGAARGPHRDPRWEPLRDSRRDPRRDSLRETRENGYGQRYGTVWLAATGSTTLVKAGQGTKPGQGRLADLDGLAHVKVVRRNGA